MNIANNNDFVHVCKCQNIQDVDALISCFYHCQSSLVNTVGVTLPAGIICSKSKHSRLNLPSSSACAGSVVHRKSQFSR